MFGNGGYNNELVQCLNFIRTRIRSKHRFTNELENSWFLTPYRCFRRLVLQQTARLATRESCILSIKNTVSDWNLWFVSGRRCLTTARNCRHRVNCTRRGKTLKIRSPNNAIYITIMAKRGNVSNRPLNGHYHRIRTWTNNELTNFGIPTKS